MRASIGDVSFQKATQLFVFGSQLLKNMQINPQLNNFTVN